MESPGGNDDDLPELRLADASSHGMPGMRSVPRAPIQGSNPARIQQVDFNSLHQIPPVETSEGFCMWQT
jgi:hypothetical protein